MNMWVRRVTLLCLLLVSVLAHAQAGVRWSTGKANQWYARQPWLVGADYVPSNAINELEMFQPQTWDPATNDRELGLAESIGMNTMRVFLHDQLWESDPAGFTKRLDAFLAIANKHHIRPMLVLFDSCWEPFPKLGPQHPPIPGVHNSGWVQSPGSRELSDPAYAPHLKAYVQGIVKAFAHDPRVLAWDVWNEPDNDNGGNFQGELKNKVQLVDELLPKVFSWVREENPDQPLTSGVWNGDWTDPQKMSATTKIQLAESDIITFHEYGWPERFTERVDSLQSLHRPLICTEYMARGNGSTFDTILPIGKQRNVGMINWGFVAGKTQTWLPWDSWKRPYVELKPTIWFHDVFNTDGSPYRQAEIDLIRRLTGRGDPPGTITGMREGRDSAGH